MMTLGFKANLIECTQITTDKQVTPFNWTTVVACLHVCFPYSCVFNDCYRIFRWI